jgi:hypothetical protein
VRWRRAGMRHSGSSSSRAPSPGHPRR